MKTEAALVRLRSGRLPPALHLADRGFQRDNPSLVRGEDRISLTTSGRTFDATIQRSGSIPAPDGPRFAGRSRSAMSTVSVLDRWSVSIELPREDPYDLPIARETGGRIPATLDNHMIDASMALPVCCFPRHDINPSPAGPPFEPTLTDRCVRSSRTKVTGRGVDPGRTANGSTVRSRPSSSTRSCWNQRRTW